MTSPMQEEFCCAHFESLLPYAIRMQHDKKVLDTFVKQPEPLGFVVNS